MGRGRWIAVAAVLALSAAATAFWFLAAAWAAFEIHRKTSLGGAAYRSSSSTPDGGFEATPAEERASLKNRDARELGPV